MRARSDARARRTAAPRCLGLLALVAIAVACRRDALTSCDDELRGVYAADDGAKWMVLDHGQTLEAYPLFADVPSKGAAGEAPLEIAPRTIALARSTATLPATSGHAPDASLSGEVRRRYLRGADRCDATAPAHVARCTGDALELVLGEPQPPLAWTPCAWPGQAPTRVARWRRAR